MLPLWVRTASVEVGELPLEAAADVLVSAAMVGAGSVTVAVVVEQPLLANGTGAGSLAASVIAEQVLVALLAGAGTLFGDVTIEEDGGDVLVVANLAGAGSLSAAVIAEWVLQASMAGAGLLSGTVRIEGEGDVSVVAAFVGAGEMFAKVTILDAPFTPNFPVPPRRAPDPRSINPRMPGGPGHLVMRPGCTIVEMMGSQLDMARQMVADVGLRPYQVFSVVVRWSGGERHRGEPSVIWEQPFLPIPKVEDLGAINKDLRPGGRVARGDVRLTGISPRYTEDQIALLFPRQLGPGDEAFIEIRMDARDGENTPRQRYIVSGQPARRAFDWTVDLTRQDEARTRSGRPQ